MWHHMDTYKREVFWAHLVSVWIGAHWVLSSQRNAARHDHKEDGHLEVAQSDHIVADPPDTANQRRGRRQHKEPKKDNSIAMVDFIVSYGLDDLNMNMLSGATRLGGVGATSSSSVSSSLWSELYASNSLLFPKRHIDRDSRGCERREENVWAVQEQLWQIKNNVSHRAGAGGFIWKRLQEWHSHQMSETPTQGHPEWYWW